MITKQNKKVYFIGLCWTVYLVLNSTIFSVSLSNCDYYEAQISKYDERHNIFDYDDVSYYIDINNTKNYSNDKMIFFHLKEKTYFKIKNNSKIGDDFQLWYIHKKSHDAVLKMTINGKNIIDFKWYDWLLWNWFYFILALVFLFVVIIAPIICKIRGKNYWEITSFSEYFE